MWFHFNCECSSHSRRGPWSVAAAERTYQRLWGECAYPWSPVDSGLCSDTWSRWARLALSPKSAPSLLVRCCHPAGGPPLVSRWRGAQGTPHSINTQAPHGMERGEKKGKRQERKQEIEGKSGGGVGGWCRESLWVSAKRLGAKDTWIIQAPIFPLMQWQVNNMH